MINILDCSLRDGGYLNNWSFHSKNQIGIINGLSQSNIDFVEIGYLQDDQSNINNTFFNSHNKIEDLIAKLNQPIKSKLVLMLDVNRFDKKFFDNIKSENIYGIRLAFYESSLDKIDNIAKYVLNCGYKVFLQPMNTFGFKKKSLNYLFDFVNANNIYLLSINDSFGSVNSSDLVQMYNFYRNNLNKEVFIGLHLHNNIGLAINNAINLIEKFPNDNILIDSTILGIGRGGGNVSTESITIFLNLLSKFPRYDTNNIFAVGWNFFDDIDIHYNLKTKLKNLMTGFYGVHPYFSNFLKQKHINSQSILSFFSLIEDKEDYRSEKFRNNLKNLQK